MGAERLIQRILKVHRGNFQAQVVGLLLGQVVEIAHQRFHARDVLENGVQEVRLLLIDRPHNPLEQQVGIPFQAGHGVLEFMRHKRDKLALRLVGPLQLGKKLRVDDGRRRVFRQAGHKVQVQQVQPAFAVGLKDQDADDLPRTAQRHRDLRDATRQGLGIVSVMRQIGEQRGRRRARHAPQHPPVDGKHARL